MTSSCCRDLKQLLDKYEVATKEVEHSDYNILAKTIIESTRQCKCLLRNPALILPLENLLKKFFVFCIQHINKMVGAKQIESTAEQITEEKLYQAVSKSLQSHYPIYLAYESVKDNFPITEEHEALLTKYCEITDNPNAPTLLLQNIAYFCQLGGTAAICAVFTKKQVSLSVASSLIGIIAQLRTWINAKTTVELIKPLSTPVTKYLCNLPEDELRLMSARAMAELMMSSVKVQSEKKPNLDTDHLEFAFKYFLSSTLTIRMAGLNLITNQIHNLVEMSQNHAATDIDSLCLELVNWLIEKRMIEVLFGPNNHIELIKQSQFLLNFLAQERHLKPEHLDSIWAAAQMKHIGRVILDLLITLTKHMDLPSVQHLLNQIAKLHVSAHTKQTLLLASLLTRTIWTSGLTGVDPDDLDRRKISPRKLSFAKQTPMKRLSVSPIRSCSPSISSEASTDDEIAGIHARRFSGTQRQVAQLRSLDLKIDENHMRTLNSGIRLPPIEELDSNFIPARSNVMQDLDDAISCTNTNGSSMSDREREMDEIDEEVAIANAITSTSQRPKDRLPFEFHVSSLCEPGKTLLWDLIQDQNNESLSEGMLEEVQKLLWQLVCYSGDLEVRKVFIQGCLHNIKNNKSVIVSFQILPKILSVFPNSHNASDASKLLDWAVKELGLMNCFFENLEQYVKDWDDSRFEAEEMLKDREVEIQSRLDFLTAMYSNEISPDIFRLTIPQVDSLWSCLVSQVADTYQFLVLSWLLKQTNSEELHALGLDASKHIFVNKLPELNAEKMTLTGLSLFQKLFGLTRLSNASPFGQETETDEYHLGVNQLWSIALRAERLHVANEAMNILNYLYITGDSSAQKEQAFVNKCMSVLQEAVNGVDSNCLESLKLIQQVLKILRNHLETYMKRLAFHIQMWKLEGKNIESHQPVLRGSSKDSVLKLVCQPAGVTDKVMFKLRSSDLLATFRADVTHWCSNVQQERDETGEDNTLPVLKPPFRLISHGHELTHDLDMKSLAEIGMRDQQLVYISSASQRKDRGNNPSQFPASLQPPPPFESVPMVQLLKESHFKQLFGLLDILYKVSKSSEYQSAWKASQDRKSEDRSTAENPEHSFEDPHELVKPLSAECLVNSTWDLVLMLPTNIDLKGKFEILDFGENFKWETMINFQQKFQLMYVLQILDSISLPMLSNGSSDFHEEGSIDSDSSLSDTDKESNGESGPLILWTNQLIDNGFVKHLHDIVISDAMNPDKGLDEWSLNSLAYIVKMLTRIGLVKLTEDCARSSEELKKKKSARHKRHMFRARYKSTETDNVVVIQRFNQSLIGILNEDVLSARLISILCCVSESQTGVSSVGSQDVHASVVFHCLAFIVCWVSTKESLRDAVISHKKFASLLIQLVFFSSQRSVRVEASRGIYKMCSSGGQDVLNKVLNMLLGKLSELVSLRAELRLQSFEKTQNQEKRPITSANYKDYFWLLGRLIEKYSEDTTTEVISIRTAILQVATYIQDDDQSMHSPHGYPYVDYCLIGLLQTCTALVLHDTEFKFSEQGFHLLRTVFHKCLFNLPRNSNQSDSIRPRCDTKAARQAGYELLIQLVSNCHEAYIELQGLLYKHHSIDIRTNQHTTYGWNYWPHEQERSSVGYVGLINLGATCYMASCMQQLFMIPKLRKSILQTQITAETKHSGILKEIQKMFAYLQESFRKAYNPRTFCKTYSMDKQPLNTGEQKDMTEFFTDAVTKVEEMSDELKKMMRDSFCGVITNNVISLDCTHVSKTEEEFYSVRCTVADMKNLYESLDEVTVKDVLEGDNKYTCSQCNDKVRAEKRACFKTLPKIMCFNTMRYTFNMVTMLKEKVNTHFSFPMKLNMAAYTEEYLLHSKGSKDPDEDSRHWYNLAGVVVHTGTADGGHYYSFIRDRHSKENSWYLFNDAEVKTFDPLQIAAECFGGEMTTKTFDTITEKYMDFSFEKTHSAYMLFYEHCVLEEEQQPEKRVSLSKELQDWLWDDNIQFLKDKLVFDSTYYNFVWQFCSLVPKSIDMDVTFFSTKLATSFLLETLVHSREKPHMKGWVELLMHGFEQSQAVCEWFLDAMASDDWWLQQLFIRCPAQALRQMFGQLCLYAIRILRPNQVSLYSQASEDDIGESDDDLSDIGRCSPITRFIRSVLNLLDENLRSYCKNLSELFHFIYQFLCFGHEECSFMLCIDAITTLIRFYINLKVSDVPEVACDDDDELEVDDDDLLSVFPEDKYYPSVLHKMIASIALLLEEAHTGTHLQLSESDLQCLLGEKDFPFIYQITLDSINLRQTANIIIHLSRFNENLAQKLVDLLLSSAQKLPMEQSQPFFKLLSLLTDVNANSLQGLPSFTSLILPKIWETAEYNPSLCIDWLTSQVPRNKTAHKWVLDNLDRWLEKYLIADSSPRIRGGAAYLLVSLVPNNNFPQAFRGRGFSAPQREWKMSPEAKSILHKIYVFLLNLISKLDKYCDTTHAGTTRLVNYFAVLNYCCISDEEKKMFTPFSNDLWKLFHPVMSEPDISVHFNKQALLTFWFNACKGCEENVKFITDTTDVVSNIAYNYILSNDDQEVISYNNATLPVYYGLLRLSCQQSKPFCKGLSVHPNMYWAFEHLMPRANHYPQTIDELLSLIQLFAGSGNYETEEDRDAARLFRRKVISIFCNSLDGQNSWTTLINVLKVLLQSEEDCVYVALMKGLSPISEAFVTLHLMYHEATACNVSSELAEIANLLQMILSCCQGYAEKMEVRKALVGWSERGEILQKAISLMNSFVSRDIHKACLELLTVMLTIFPEETIEILAPAIHQSHMAIRLIQSPAPVGGYFPKCYSGSSSGKGISRKSSLRASCPELNMTLHPGLIESPKGKDEGYDAALYDYFHGYHVFVDKLCRYGLNLEQVPTIIIEISCLLSVEALPLQFVLFPKLWQEVWSKSNDNPKYKNCIQRLFSCESFIEYVDTLFTDERILLDNATVYAFICLFIQKIHHRLLVDQKQAVLNTIMSSIASDAAAVQHMDYEEFEKIARRMNGDLRALCLLLSVTTVEEVTVAQMLESCIEKLLLRYNQHKNELEERRQLKRDITNSTNQDSESKDKCKIVKNSSKSDADDTWHTINDKAAPEKVASPENEVGSCLQADTPDDSSEPARPVASNYPVANNNEVNSVDDYSNSNDNTLEDCQEPPKKKLKCLQQSNVDEANERQSVVPEKELKDETKSESKDSEPSSSGLNDNGVAQSTSSLAMKRPGSNSSLSEKGSDDSNDSSDVSSSENSSNDTPSSTSDPDKLGAQKSSLLRRSSRTYNVTDMLKKTSEHLLSLLKRRKEKQGASS